MHQRTHHIPILAGFEILPNPAYQPTLSKRATETLAEALAQDLSRRLPFDASILLVVGGVVLEPNQLLRPGFLVWQALEHLSKPVIRDHGLHSGVLAIGAHHGTLPDERLNPTIQPLMGQFACIPMLLITTLEDGPAIEAHLESQLFESGSINPPARAALSEHTKLESVHGQLLTRNDLMALQRVQLDAADLSGFWDVIEIALIHGDVTQDISLPGELHACWCAEKKILEIHFLTLDQWLFDDEDLATRIQRYAIWLRAYRTLIALIESHHIPWRVIPSGGAVVDDNEQYLIETSSLPSNRTSKMETLTQQHDPSVGVVAWSWVEDGRLINLYPLTQAAIVRLTKDFAQRGLESKKADSLCYNAELRILMGLPRA